MRKKIQKIFCGLLIFTMFIVLITPQVEAQPFDINGKAAILMDASTGEILYEKNIHEPLPPASITKIMTMLLVMEALENNKITLDDQVVVSERASSMGGTQLYLEPGEVKIVEDLMKGIAIRSANDACVAIAEHIAGSEELFVQRMNERAQELGMKNTNFVNTNGLPVEGHVTSAYDIALMSRELLKHEEVHRWLTTWMDTVVVGKRKESMQELVNTNRLIRFYQGANGIKTGYTSEAMHCLAASATRGNSTFIAVVMAAPTSQTRFNEAAKLLDYAFANFNTIEIIKKDVPIEYVRVQKGKEIEVRGIAKDDLKVLVKKGEESKVDKRIILPQYIYAPVLKGEKIGEMIAMLDGKEVGKIDIVSEESIEKASILDIFIRFFKQLTGN